MAVTGCKRQVWEPSQYFGAKDCTEDFGIIILNESLHHQNIPLFSQLWNAASVRVCVDGAVNQYHELLWAPHQSSAASSELQRKSTIHQVNDSSAAITHVALPDFISGDFDSANPIFLDLFLSLGVSIIHTPDQNETDFTKAIKEMMKYLDKKALKVSHVLAVVSCKNNRFDHSFAHLNTLYKVQDTFPVPVVLISQWTMTWLLSSKMEHVIHIPSNLRVTPRPEEAWCALVPLGHPATVSTKGLKWNLSEMEMAFGKLVSTSNTYDLTGNGQVQVWTSHPIIWTMGFMSEMQKPIKEYYCQLHTQLASSVVIDEALYEMLLGIYINYICLPSFINSSGPFVDHL
ncbi:thiamine pyrophosphokinase 1 isoform X2 [Oratosquilla oratoria]|uniref:thiamine pyrophosphokinase 1 isoform X2 n=1 Tax=Oratosquilla oratoria TaxID=337810 RepID=UPI003F76A918